MAKLPLDIINDLFSRLPPEALLRFRCLSKELRSLIDSHEFIKLHLHRSIETNSNRCLIINHFKTNCLVSEVDLDSLDINLISRNDPLEAYATFHDVSSIKGFQIKRVLPWKNRSDVIGSCNGLIALYNGAEVALWNPSTRKHHLFAKFWGDCRCGEFLLAGFGYDAVSDDYKLVAIFLHYQGAYYSLRRYCYCPLLSFGVS
uniref:Uncharacterized protein MANES_04G117600 n=1 Tax=Rhizophora mucronata TaxID=61149 RepID=A0A2P2MYH0_RHIMU